MNQIVKRFLCYPFVLAARFFREHPGLRLRCVALIRSLGLYNILRAFYFRFSVPQNPRNLSLKAGQLSPRAYQIYTTLKFEMMHRGKEKR